MKNYQLLPNDLFSGIITNKTLDGKNRTSDPIFIMLKDKTFNNWTIQLDDFDFVKNKLCFSYSILSVPKTVDDKFVKKNKKHLDKFLTSVIINVVEECLNNQNLEKDIKQ